MCSSPPGCSKSRKCGGTFGTGDPTQQTVTGAEAAANVRNATEGPGGTLNAPVPSGAPGTGTSGYGVGNNNTPPTNSSAWLTRARS